MKEATLDTRRRTLLTAAACAPAIAVAALLARRSSAETVVPAPVQEEDVPHSSGYHETEHIRKYYRSAAF